MERETRSRNVTLNTETLCHFYKRNETYEWLLVVVCSIMIIGSIDGSAANDTIQCGQQSRHCVSSAQCVILFFTPK